MSGETSKGLGYSFTPMPSWLLIMWQRGQLSDPARDLHLAIYELAPTSVLEARSEFHVRRATLARKCRRDDDEAFRKLVRREYDRGHHGLRVEGHASTGISYVIKPYPDGPLVRPVSDQKQPGNPLSEPDSEPPREEPVGEVSDQTASLSDQETAGKPHPEPGSASSGKAACPISLDVLDNPRPSGYEELRTGSLREDPARGTVAGERTPNGTHGAMKPTLADLAATARAAQQARDLASLSSLPTPERDLLTDLLQTFDGVLVTEETTK